MGETEQLRAELAARKRTCSCSYWAHTDEVMPSPNCPTHGVDANDKRILGDRAIAILRDLVGLKYADRDRDYRATKAFAWQQARELLMYVSDVVHHP